MPRMTAASAIYKLDTLPTDDPEGAHAEADEILLAAVDPSVKAAYERVVSRCSWWASA